jgi:hypothetical protein
MRSDGFRRGAEAILAAAGELGVLEQLEADRARAQAVRRDGLGGAPVPERGRPRARGQELLRVVERG